MIPIIKKEKAIHYISESDMIAFIKDNSDYEWNDLCKLMRKEGISSDEGKAYWSGRIDLDSIHYNDFQKTWINAFFDTHPFIERFILVFDD